MPLVFVPTPLGNLRDVTLRALDVLRACDVLVAEDTRVAKKLLNALALPGKETWPYHEHNAATATPRILERARTQTVAVVCDAGMPGISDPGTMLVAAARAAGIAIDVLPGPSAVTSAAVLSGFPLRRFIFEGFPPRTSSARKEHFANTFALGVPSVWYESPMRIRATLADIAAVDPSAEVFLLREYTKHFEQQLVGTASEISARLGDRVRGEIALVVRPSPPVQTQPTDAVIGAEIDTLLDCGQSVAKIAKSLSERGYGERAGLYARASARKRLRRDEGSHPQ